MIPRLTLPPNPATLALIALAFTLPGLPGHDLWKTHDAIALGIVHDMVVDGAPLVPRVAGAPWLFDPPLYHWIAAGFGALLQRAIEFHSAARLASAALMLAAFWLIYLAARNWANAEEDRRVHGSDVPVEVGDALGVVHPAVDDHVGIRRAVLGDHDRRQGIAEVGAQRHEQFGERLGHDGPAEAGHGNAVELHGFEACE